MRSEYIYSIGDTLAYVTGAQYPQSIYYLASTGPLFIILGDPSSRGTFLRGKRVSIRKAFASALARAIAGAAS